mgnify:CR=1 FL=1
MAQTGLYPGIGAKMYRASSNAQEPVFPETMTIPSGSSSMGWAVNGGMNVAINVTYGTAPSGTAFTVKYDTVPTFASEVTLDTVAASGSDKVYAWSTQGMYLLTGFIRISNAGGQDITTAYIQQQAATA